jgi:phosphomannomutase
MKPIPIFVGYDPREAIAYHVCANSIIRQASQPVAIIPLALNLFSDYTETHTDGSNHFIYSRFLVPHLMDYLGHAIFIDGDMIVRADIAELWDLRDHTVDVQVVKHDYQTRMTEKYLGAKNENYPRKNWSSVILWNCQNPANKRLTPQFIEKATGAELGLAFDGDGDRLGIVTQDGETIYPDRQMQMFAEDVLSRVPGGTILFDVKCSQRLAPAIRGAGGQALMYKTGHSLIKAKMKQIEAEGGQAPLGGEMSGHIFFKERWYGFDDGTYAGCRLLEIVSRSPDANAVLKALPTSFSTPELNVSCQEGEPHSLTAQLLKIAPQHFSAPAEISDIDGLRVDWPDGFGLIRASNTTPVLVLRFEGHTQEALHRIEHHMLALLKTVKPDASLQASAH